MSNHDRIEMARRSPMYRDRRESLLRGVIDWRIPEHMHQGVIDYVLDGLPPGGFLEAALSDSGQDAAARADDLNFATLGRWFAFIHNCVPGAAARSYENVARWIGHGGLLGLIAEIDRKREDAT